MPSSSPSAVAAAAERSLRPALVSAWTDDDARPLLGPGSSPSIRAPDRRPPRRTREPHLPTVTHAVTPSAPLTEVERSQLQRLLSDGRPSSASVVVAAVVAAGFVLIALALLAGIVLLPVWLVLRFGLAVETTLDPGTEAMLQAAFVGVVVVVLALTTVVGFRGRARRRGRWAALLQNGDDEAGAVGAARRTIAVTAHDVAHDVATEAWFVGEMRRVRQHLADGAGTAGENGERRAGAAEPDEGVDAELFTVACQIERPDGDGGGEPVDHTLRARIERSDGVVQVQWQVEPAAWRSPSGRSLRTARAEAVAAVHEALAAGEPRSLRWQLADVPVFGPAAGPSETGT
jgi:hypothetical protein